jgi:hypothetical protein
MNCQAAAAATGGAIRRTAGHRPERQVQGSEMPGAAPTNAHAVCTGSSVVWRNVRGERRHAFTSIAPNRQQRRIQLHRPPAVFTNVTEREPQRQAKRPHHRPFFTTRRHEYVAQRQALPFRLPEHTRCPAITSYRPQELQADSSEGRTEGRRTPPSSEEMSPAHGVQ